MNGQIINSPFTVNLVGRQGAIEGKPVGEVGKRLMDAMWAEVRTRGIRNTGINHWVYLPGPQLFTGVELSEPTDDVGPLERLSVELKRYLRHVHQGPYDELPALWQQLTNDLAANNENRAGPCLEIYGHWNADPSLLTTTILIGLAPKQP